MGSRKSRIRDGGARPDGRHERYKQAHLTHHQAREQLVGEVLQLAGRALDQDHFHDLIVGQVHVQGADDLVDVSELGVRQLGL